MQVGGTYQAACLNNHLLMGGGCGGYYTARYDRPSPTMYCSKCLAEIKAKETLSRLQMLSEHTVSCGT